jgi:hypothetical protein
MRSSSFLSSATNNTADSESQQTWDAREANARQRCMVKRAHSDRVSKFPARENEFPAGINWREKIPCLLA